MDPITLVFAGAAVCVVLYFDQARKAKNRAAQKAREAIEEQRRAAEAAKEATKSSFGFLFWLLMIIGTAVALIVASGLVPLGK